MGNVLPFGGELEFAPGTKIHPKRVTAFRSLLGEYVAKAAQEAFWDGAVEAVTIAEMPTHAQYPPYGRRHPAETYSPREWLGEDD